MTCSILFQKICPLSGCEASFSSKTSLHSDSDLDGRTRELQHWRSKMEGFSKEKQTSKALPLVPRALLKSWQDSSWQQTMSHFMSGAAQGSSGDGYGIYLFWFGFTCDLSIVMMYDDDDVLWSMMMYYDLWCVMIYDSDGFWCFMMMYDDVRCTMNTVPVWYVNRVACDNWFKIKLPYVYVYIYMSHVVNYGALSDYLRLHSNRVLKVLAERR